jgi:hypothetical protein
MQQKVDAFLFSSKDIGLVIGTKGLYITKGHLNFIFCYSFFIYGSEFR